MTNTAPSSFSTLPQLQVVLLSDMGFPRDKVINALAACKGQQDEAIQMLLREA